MYSIIKNVRIKDGIITVNGGKYFQQQNGLELFLTESYQTLEFNYPKFYKMDMLSKLGFIAAELLLKNFKHDHIPAFRKGFIFQNSSSSLEADKLFQASIQHIASPALFVYTLPNIVMGELAIRHQFKGENTFFVSEKFDVGDLMKYLQTIESEDILDLLLVGFIEINNHVPDILLCLIEKGSGAEFTAAQLQLVYDQD